MRQIILPLLLALLGTGAAAAAAPGAPDRAACERAFRAYENALWLYPDNQWGDDVPVLRPDVARAARGLVRAGCLTTAQDLVHLPALAQSLAPFAITDSGPAIRPTTVSLGIVTGFGVEHEATLFFRGLGYRSRGVGAQTLGRRLFIGPFTSQGALDQALEVARQAGFIAPHVALHTRF